MKTQIIFFVALNLLASTVAVASEIDLALNQAIEQRAIAQISWATETMEQVRQQISEQEVRYQAATASQVEEKEFKIQLRTATPTQQEFVAPMSSQLAIR